MPFPNRPFDLVALQLHPATMLDLSLTHTLLGGGDIKLRVWTVYECPLRVQGDGVALTIKENIRGELTMEDGRKVQVRDRGGESMAFTIDFFAYLAAMTESEIYHYCVGRFVTDNAGTRVVSEELKKVTKFSRLSLEKFYKTPYSCAIAYMGRDSNRGVKVRYWLGGKTDDYIGLHWTPLQILLECACDGVVMHYNTTAQGWQSIKCSTAFDRFALLGMDNGYYIPEVLKWFYVPEDEIDTVRRAMSRIKYDTYVNVTCLRDDIESTYLTGAVQKYRREGVYKLATVIQSVYRGWVERMKYRWSPYTTLGRYHIMKVWNMEE